MQDKITDCGLCEIERAAMESGRKFGVLQESATEDLLGELFNRMEHAIFVGLRESVEGNDSYRAMHFWKGNAHMCCGMAFEMGMGALQEMPRWPEDKDGKAIENG